jgi:hypothetical protein
MRKILACLYKLRFGMIATAPKIAENKVPVFLLNSANYTILCPKYEA